MVRRGYGRRIDERDDGPPASDSGDSGTSGTEVTKRPTVVTALPLRADARERLAELLGATVVDMRTPIEHPDLVLTPACSPQPLGGLKRRFEDCPADRGRGIQLGSDVELDGPVKRILGAGADAYVLADSIDELAEMLGGAHATTEHVPWTPHELEGPTMDDLVAAFLEESVSYAQRLPDDPRTTLTPAAAQAHSPHRPTGRPSEPRGRSCRSGRIRAQRPIWA